MYLSDEQVLSILNELKPFHAEEGKAAKEATSCLLRFLAFDLLCKSQNSESLQFPNTSSAPDYQNRERLTEAYRSIGCMTDSDSKEYAITHFGGIDPKRDAKSKIGNDFLTAQVRQAQETINGKDYPSRPSSLLHIEGSNSWVINKHKNWKVNIDEFLGSPRSKKLTQIAQFLFRSSHTDLESLKDSLREQHTGNLAEYWIEQLSERHFVSGSSSIPPSDDKIIDALLSNQNCAEKEIGNTALSSNSPTSSLNTMLSQLLDSAEKASLRLESLPTLQLTSSLLTKPFLILTGLSGSGKTKLAQAFAHWITPKPEEGELNPHIALIPVGADWMGNENILGYPNGLNHEGYVTTPALKLILHAQAKREIPHFLILDEMNLSHVERYFADFLSAIESGEKIPLYQGIHRKDGELEIPTDLELPENLFVIGTVNVDETTYMFSPKVLDRANVIEFRMEESDLTNFLATPSKPNLDALAEQGKNFGAAFVDAASDPDKAVPGSMKTKFDEEMTKFFKVLATEGTEFGYRTAYESGRFLHFYDDLRKKEDDDTWFDDAFDAVIAQKFLPKLHGSSSKLSKLLHGLWKLCQPTPAPREDGDEKKEDKTPAINQENAKSARFPMSAAKIARMIKVLERNGFVSFAEA